ncbi:MAG: helix-turn-helix domain-containing protein [Rhodopila sp.]
MGMPASGSSAFTDADGYQANLRDMLDVLVLQPRAFHARVTWLELPLLNLLRIQETSQRIAYVRLPPELAFITFPIDGDAPLICNGIELHFGDIMFHSRGDRFHQRTIGACRWGTLSLTPTSLSAWAMTIIGEGVAPPIIRQALRPTPSDHRLLLRLHSDAARLAEHAPVRISHTEVVRALEQDLLLALLNCFTIDQAIPGVPATAQDADKMAQFEDMLAAQPYRLLRSDEIRDALDISDHAFRTSCARVLGMSPGRYQRLRRLKRVRADLLRLKTADVAGVIAQYGFPDMHRFAVEYWQTYGEMPPIPARNGRDR